MKNIRISDYYSSIGASLSLVGVPLGMYLNQFAGGIKWSPIIMFLSIILLMDWRNFDCGLSRLFSSKLKWMIFFQFMMILYGLMSIENNMTGQYLSFHIYIIALCYAYSTHKGTSFLTMLPKTLFYVSYIASVLGAFYCNAGMVAGDDAYQMRISDDSFALEMFTVASGALTNFFAALVFDKEKKYEKILFAIAIALDVFVLISCTKRTPVFVAIVGTLVFLYKSGFLKRKYSKKYFSYMLLFFIVSILCYSRFQSFREGVDDLFMRLFNGIRILVGDSSVSNIEDSTQSRVLAREWAYNYMNLNFSLTNYLFGAGYLTKWLDIPILEAYMDMGIIGFLFYAYFIVWNPLKALLCKKQTKAVLLALLYSLYTTFSMFNSGNPYMYIKYTGVTLLIYSMFTVPLNKKTLV